MKGQLMGDSRLLEEEDLLNNEEGEGENLETWTEEMFRKRSEELKLIDNHGNTIFRKLEVNRCESRVEEMVLSDVDQSPSRTTSTESQVNKIFTIPYITIFLLQIKNSHVCAVFISNILTVIF